MLWLDFGRYLCISDITSFLTVCNAQQQSCSKISKKKLYIAHIIFAHRFKQNLLLTLRFFFVNIIEYGKNLTFDLLTLLKKDVMIIQMLTLRNNCKRKKNENNA